MVLIRHDNLESESNKNNSPNISKKRVRFALEDTTAKHYNNEVCEPMQRVNKGKNKECAADENLQQDHP
jgi:hypothetical protein